MWKISQIWKNPWVLTIFMVYSRIERTPSAVFLTIPNRLAYLDTLLLVTRNNSGRD